MRVSLSFNWLLYRYKGGDGDGRKERSQCFNLGLGNNSWNSSRIGRRVHNILEAIRPDAENKLRKSRLNLAALELGGFQDLPPSPLVGRGRLNLTDPKRQNGNLQKENLAFNC